MKHYHTGVFIGRFQPFHLGHWHIIQQGLKQCDQLLLMVGSANKARTAKNPFNITERIVLIEHVLQELDLGNAHRVKCIATTDHPYDEPKWIENIQQVTQQQAQGNTIALVGHDKDESTYYLQHFSNWGQVAVDNYKGINATQIRHAMFSVECEDKLAEIPEIPQATIALLKSFYQTEIYHNLRKENAFIASYQQEWANTPYPVIYVTTDAIVTCEQHILLIKRKQCPGHDLHALPGGFLEANEWVEDGLIRELIEETSIDMSITELKRHLKTTHVFDRPNRSQIGRVITHAGHIDLPGKKPKVKAADDAKAVDWVPLTNFWNMAQEMHDDHYFIVEWYLQNKG